MSESDSFIEEVSEEVRRDRLYGYFRRYGWIALVAVFLIVGGAAFSEYRKAQTRASEQATGDEILAALREADAGARATALAGISADDAAAGAVVRLSEAAALVDAGDNNQALEVLRSLADTTEAGPVYADLARAKAVMLDPEAEWSGTAIEELATAGRPFRLLGLELRAQAKIRDGDTEAALADLTTILEDPSVTPNLRDRVTQMIISLGGEVPRGSQLVPQTGDG